MKLSTYRVTFNDSYFDKDGKLQIHSRSIYLDMPGPNQYSSSVVSDVVMERFIPDENL